MQPPETIGKTAAEGSQRTERRRYGRCSCDVFAEAVVLHRGSMFRGEILDISQNGCFVMTKAFLRVERYAEVNLRFTFNKVDYHTTALVMNVRPGKGVGLEFSFDDAQTEESFHALIEELSAAPPPE